MSAKELRARAAELEQFRFSLGELLGVPSLAVHPRFELFLLPHAPALQQPLRTRTGAEAWLQGWGPLTPETRRAFAHLLVEDNVRGIPDDLQRGLETFLSTTQVQGAKVTWGALPPVGERDAAWALVDWLVTNPETYGNLRVLFANLERQVDEGVAYRNALHRTRGEVEKEVAKFVQTGRFETVDGPSRPLSAERDLAAHALESADAALLMADFLDGESEARYRELLKAGTHRAEAEEGLALLALRRNEHAEATEWWNKAIRDGSPSAATTVEFARAEPDAGKAQAMLERAVVADPHSAEAHFALGMKLSDPAKRIGELETAVKLESLRQEYWVALAQTLVEQKKWDVAAKAWRGAEQAARTKEEREKMISARLAIEGDRLDFEAAEKRREGAAREEEIRRLKQQAIAEIRAAEARVNAGSAPPGTSGAVAWEDLEGKSVTAHAEGALVRVECSAHAKRLVVRVSNGETVKLTAGSSRTSAKSGGFTDLACGTRPERAVSVQYIAHPNPRTGTAGEAVSVEYPQPAQR